MAPTTRGGSATLKRLYETGEWSDLTIETVTKSFKVHKNIVCPACAFFNAACSNGFKESHTGIIRLEESEIVVDAILRHIYELPIEWLRYDPYLYQDAVGQRKGLGTIKEYSSTVISKSRGPTQIEGEDLRRVLYDLLELDIAIDKYNLLDLSRQTDGAFMVHYVKLEEVEVLVEVGNAVFDQMRAGNGLLQAYVAAKIYKHLGKVLKTPRAWTMLYSNEKYVKATLLEWRED